MQVNDQVQVTKPPEGDEESLGRAGLVISERMEGDVTMFTVRLDETTSHEGGDAEYAEGALTFLGR